MRLAKISLPEQHAAQVINLAFSDGIEKISTAKITIHYSYGKFEERAAIDIETSTPKAKKITKLLLSK